MNQMKVPLSEKISYGLGDAASNLSYTTISSFLLFFYTDVAGIGAAVAGIIMLVARLFDAIFDPFMGTIIDKTHTRWGRCRPYFLWMAIPYGIVMVLLFTVPDFGTTGKVAYAVITYLIFGIIYSAVNLPLSAMLPSMSDDPNERTSINSVRMICGRLAGLAANMSIVPLTALLGSGNKSKGMFFTILIFACIAVVLFFITFANTRERVEIKKSEETVKLKDAIRATVKNKYWWIIAGVSLVFFVSTTLMQQSAMYIFANYFKNMSIMVVFALTLFAAQIIAMLFAPTFVKKIGKRNISLVGLAFAVLGALIRLLAGHALPVFLAGNVVCGIGIGFMASVLLAMMADAVDFSELKYKVRAQGLMYAADSFSMKVGAGLGGAIGGWVLAAGSYAAGSAAQSPSAMTSIIINFHWGPMIGFALSAVFMIFYNLDKNIVQVRKELKERREGFSSTANADTSAVVGS